MDTSRITAAVWPWGINTRQEMETAAREIREIGYVSYESIKSSIYAYEWDLAAYKEMLDRFGITPVSFYYHLPAFGDEASVFENLDRELDFISKLGVERLCLQATSGRPDVMDDEKKRFETELIEKFARLTKEFGITTNLHNHHNTWVMYEDEIDYVFANVDPSILSYAPDTAHLVAGECDPVKVIRKYADRVNFIHLKDIKSAKINSEGVAGYGVEVYKDFCELGQGCVDFRQVFDILKSVNYTGPLCAELDIAPISNYLSAKNNYEYIVKNY